MCALVAVGDSSAVDDYIFIHLVEEAVKAEQHILGGWAGCPWMNPVRGGVAKAGEQIPHECIHSWNVYKAGLFMPSSMLSMHRSSVHGDVCRRGLSRPGSTSSMDASEGMVVDDDDIVGPMDMSDSPDLDGAPASSRAHSVSEMEVADILSSMPDTLTSRSGSLGKRARIPSRRLRSFGV